MRNLLTLFFLFLILSGCGIKQMRMNIDATKARTDEIYRWQQQQIESDIKRDSLLKAMAHQINSLENQLRTFHALTTNRLNDLDLSLSKVHQSILETSGRFSDVAMGVSEVRKRVVGDSADEDTTSARVALDAADQDLAKGNYELAIAGYSTFLERWANSPLAGNAYIGRGEAKLATKDTSGAIADFRAATQTKCPKLPTAYWLLGKTLHAKKDIKGAKEAWQTLVKKFPDTTEAVRAKEKLRELEKKR
ncbi:MAG: tetratricopeptide repeat protein [bacterium]|nr:tetratricopeptide repeat protein [bacterium]